MTGGDVQRGATEEPREKEGAVRKVGKCSNARGSSLRRSAQASRRGSEGSVEGRGLEERPLDWGEQSCTGDWR